MMKKLLVAVALFVALPASQVRAAVICSLAVERASAFVSDQPVQIGEAYGFGVELQFAPDAGPLYPFQATPPYTISFYGAKNGVPDIGDPGEIWPGTYGLGFWQLWGYNPGGFAGVYDRYVVVRGSNGVWACTSNTVTITLM